MRNRMIILWLILIKIINEALSQDYELNCQENLSIIYFCREVVIRTLKLLQ